MFQVIKLKMQTIIEGYMYNNDNIKCYLFFPFKEQQHCFTFFLLQNSLMKCRQKMAGLPQKCWPLSRRLASELSSTLVRANDPLFGRLLAFSSSSSVLLTPSFLRSVFRSLSHFFPLAFHTGNSKHHI
jgi:hypothetical protein